MQSYFRLSASSRLRRPLSIFGLPEQYQKAAEKDVFDHLDQAIVAYFRAEAHEELPAVLSDPSFLISDELKKLFTLYIPDLQAKMIQYLQESLTAGKAIDIGCLTSLRLSVSMKMWNGIRMAQ